MSKVQRLQRGLLLLLLLSLYSLVLREEVMHPSSDGFRNWS